MDDLISVKDVPQPLIEAIVVHEIFRGIGVSAKDIYLDLQHLPEVRVVAVVGGTAYAIVVYKSWMEDPGVASPRTVGAVGSLVERWLQRSKLRLARSI